MCLNLKADIVHLVHKGALEFDSWVETAEAVGGISERKLAGNTNENKCNGDYRVH